MRFIVLPRPCSSARSQEGELLLDTATRQIEMRPVAALKPYRGNARQHSKRQVRQIADSITRFGFTNPVLVSDDGEIVAGHGRVMAARELELDAVPTLRPSHLSAEERRAARPASACAVAEIDGQPFALSNLTTAEKSQLPNAAREISPALAAALRHKCVSQGITGPHDHQERPGTGPFVRWPEGNKNHTISMRYMLAVLAV